MQFLVVSFWFLVGACLNQDLRDLLDFQDSKIAGVAWRRVERSASVYERIAREWGDFDFGL